MNIKLVLAIIISKIVLVGCRLFKQGGTTLPGKIAMKIYPNILSHLSKDYRIIMVTGTNGKTTTTRIIGSILKENKIEYISNKSGANLIGGVVTIFVKASDIWGRSKTTTALFEVDEGVFHIICEYVKPHILVVTNFFRDQLDRYGELHNTIKSVSAGIQKAGDLKLVLNADDSLCSSLGKDNIRETIYYGISQDAILQNQQDPNTTVMTSVVNTDAAFCYYCKSRYIYNYRTYGHLGGFTCQECGYSRPDTHVTCTNIYKLSSSDSLVEFSFNGGQDNSSNIKARINLPGAYNIYNALAAAACGHAMGLSPANTVNALGNFESGFGRMEKVSADGKNIILVLVKNPTGFNQVLNLLCEQSTSVQDRVHIAFVINDHAGDGADISWLWDVNIEKLQNIQDSISHIYTSGTRAEDMNVRLKYGDIYTNKISMIKDYYSLVETGLSRIKENEMFYIYASYTAMLEIRKILKKKYKLKEF